MSPRLVHFRGVVRRLAPLATVASLLLAVAAPSRSGTPDGKRADLEKPKARPDARLNGYRVPDGFKVRVAAAEPALLDPAAMAFDDHGNLFVAEWRPADRAFETRDAVGLAGQGGTRVRRTRKSTTDVVKKLKDADGDGIYESSEVVLEGCELPTSILPWKDSLFLTCVGRLERWADEDGDGHFESRTVVLDGFAGLDRRGLGGATLGLDGWLYLAVGDDDSHVVGPDELRGDLARTGGVFRCRPDGSRLSLIAMGLRNPSRGPAFDGHFDPYLVDGDHEDGSKLQGLRLVNPSEEGDYGWRLRSGSTGGQADFDRATVNGEGPGKLPVVARLGRGAASGLIVCNGQGFPEAMRETLVLPDPARRAVRIFKVEARGAARVLTGETTLLSADDDQFRPVQASLGADGAIYVLDRRGPEPGDHPPGGEGKAGRLYRISWDGEKSPPSSTPAEPPSRPNHWDRVAKATTEEVVFKYLTSKDHGEADRALRELVERGPTSLIHCLGWSTNAQAATYTRLLGIQGARQFWCDQVESSFVALLGDADPDVRRLAAQGLAWEPKEPLPRLVPKLLPHLDDTDPRVAREVALAVGRHGEPRPQQASAVLLRWLIAHPLADPATRDAFIRGLERLGDAGVEEVALAIRTRRGVEREAAVAHFARFRSAAAAERLEGLVKVPDLSTPERVALIRHFADFPPDVPAPTQGLVDWMLKHADLDPPLKLAALDACRLAGNPASSLVLRLLDDDDEAVRQAATRLAARTRPPGSIELLTDRLKNRNTPAAERLALVRALRWAGPKAFDALDASYLAAEDAETRRVALRSMADADRVRAVPALESALTGPDPALRAQSARILGESPKTALVLGRAFAARTVRREDLPIVLDALRKHDGPEARKLLASIEDDARSGPAALSPAEVLDRLAQGADPWAGLGVFFRESSRCSTCHRVENRGAGVGPPLGLATSNLSPERLVDSILNPSRAVRPKYESTRVTLKEGRSFVGLVTASDAKLLTLREPSGREVRMAPELIETQAVEHGSPMPEHVALDLTPDELVDLVAFLRSKPAQNSLKHGPKKLDRALAIGPFPLGADRLRVPLDRIDLARTYEGQDGTRAAWTPLDATQAGDFNLRGEVAARPGRAYLAADIRSASEQTAVLRFAVEGATRAYLNGARVADVPEHDAPALAPAFARASANTLAPLPDLARLHLKPGANLLLIAVDRVDDNPGDLRAVFDIASPEPVEVRMPRN